MWFIRTVRGRMLTLAAAAALMIAAGTLGWWNVLSTLKVNGPLYEDIVHVKDLVGDILPPPEYIIESYLTAARALDADSGEEKAFSEKMAQLKADYESRHQYWGTIPLDPQIADMLLTRSYQPAEQFYRISADRFFPALRRNDKAAAKAAFIDMSAAYEDHRQVIDKLAALSDDYNKATETRAADRERRSKAVVLAMTAGTMAAMVVGILLMARSVTAPLGRLVAAIGALRAGQTDIEIPDTTRQDELGPLAQALDQWRVSLVEAAGSRKRDEQELALKLERQRQVEEAAALFNASIQSVLDRFKQGTKRLFEASERLTANAQHTQERSTSVSAATEQATTNMEAVASSSIELSASISEISRQVQQSVGTAGTASEEAAEARAKIAGLADAVHKIGEVVDLIGDIAAQTNLLALNATIESARAGDAGKGFAVVANEVKGLASQTGRATGEIGEQIAGVQAEASDVVGAITGISHTIGSINEMATIIAGAVEEQGAATSEIAHNVDQASSGMREVAASIAGVAALAQETGGMAVELNHEARKLVSESDKLEEAIRSFVATMMKAG